MNEKKYWWDIELHLTLDERDNIMEALRLLKKQVYSNSFRINSIEKLLQRLDEGDYL